MAQLALLILCIIWGTTFFSQSIGVRALGDHPLAACLFLGVRFVLATAVMAACVPRVFRHLDRTTVRDGIVLSLPFAFGFASQVSGLRSTTPTISAFITNLTVVFTPIVGMLLFRERVGKALAVGVGLSLTGLTVMTRPWESGLGPGEILTVASAVAFTFQIHLTDIFTKRSSPLGITFVMFAAASGYFLLVLLLFPDGRALLAEAPMHLRNPDFAWTAAYNAVVASVIGILLMNVYQKRVSPTRAALIYMTEPVFAAFFARMFVGESMTAGKIVGGAIILAGNLACELLQKRKPPPQITGSAIS